MFGYLFLSALDPQPKFSTLSTLLFLLLQNFEFTFLFKFCCVIRKWSSNFDRSSYLQPRIGSIHQSYTAGASLGEELIGIFSLGAGDFILRGLMAFKICHMPGYGWAMIAKIVHQLKLLQLSRFYDRSSTMPRVITVYQKLMTT